MATTAEQLAEINAAITKILGGAQEYQMMNSRVRRADLGQLLTERKRLESLLAGETYGDAQVAYFDRR